MRIRATYQVFLKYPIRLSNCFKIKKRLLALSTGVFLFLQKKENMKEAVVEIINYTPQYKDDFKRLNVEWISTYFTVEPHDLVQLDDPEGYILSKGGHIFFAQKDEVIVGTVALIKVSDTSYELAKMGVSPQYQGLGAGKKLALKVIEEAKRLGGNYLSLESNQILIPALTMYKSIGFVEIPMGETPYARANFKAEMYL